MSWLCILTVYIKVSNSFSFLANSLMPSFYIRWLIFFLRYMFVSACAYYYYYYYYYYNFLLIRVFYISVCWLSFTGVWVTESPHVSWTLLSILAVLYNVVVWMVSTRPPTSKSSSPFSTPLVTVPNAPITIGIIVTCMFHSFFNSLARSRYLSFFSNSFTFILWSAGTVKSTILQVLFFYYY